MALTPKQRTVIFRVFIILVMASACLEIFIIMNVINTGDVRSYKSIVAILNGGGLFLLFRKFIRMIDDVFRKLDMIDERHLKSYFENRLACLNYESPPENLNALYSIISALSQQILKLTESILYGWIGPFHFELSVFENSTTPRIIAYYDSGGDNEPRSKKAREDDPDYYRKKRHEVVELLENPNNSIFYLPNTHLPEASYSFLNKEQEKNIKSTLLYCFCNDGPCALVITCDRPGALAQDPRLDSLIRAIGLAMRAEYNLGNILSFYIKKYGEQVLTG